VLKPIAEAALNAAVAVGNALGETGKTLAGATQDYAGGFARGLRKAAKKQGPGDGEKSLQMAAAACPRRSGDRSGRCRGVFAELGQLIAKFPQAFEWLERVLHFIK
jgi:hypothetical protein